MSEIAVSCVGRCHAIITGGKDKGRVCGQTEDHTNHQVHHWFDPECAAQEVK